MEGVGHLCRASGSGSVVIDSARSHQRRANREAAKRSKHLLAHLSYFIPQIRCMNDLLTRKVPHDKLMVDNVEVVKAKLSYRRSIEFSDPAAWPEQTPSNCTHQT